SGFGRMNGKRVENPDGSFFYATTSAAAYGASVFNISFRVDQPYTYILDTTISGSTSTVIQFYDAMSGATLAHQGTLQPGRTYAIRASADSFALTSQACQSGCTDAFAAFEGNWQFDLRVGALGTVPPPAPVPLPAAGFLLLSGLMGLGVIGR